MVIAGPTASGKTKIAIELAKIYGSEIISADSRQFYRKMDIGTAKPSPAELKLITHHFIDSLEISEKYNIGMYETDAIKKLDELHLKHDVVFITGGSGLYIDAVCKGIDNLPDSVPEIREELMSLYKTEGIESLQNKLREIDPEYYSDSDINNPHRLMRALEVFMISGKKYSTLRLSVKKKRHFVIKKTGILIERDDLYMRINNRVDAMIQSGMVNEVKSLLPYRNENALQTVGYREIIDYLDNNISLDEAINKIKQNTRNYAKRQMTWFRKDPEIKWFTPDETGRMMSFIEDDQ